MPTKVKPKATAYPIDAPYKNGQLAFSGEDEFAIPINNGNKTQQKTMRCLLSRIIFMVDNILKYKNRMAQEVLRLVVLSKQYKTTGLFLGL